MYLLSHELCCETENCYNFLFSFIREGLKRKESIFSAYHFTPVHVIGTCFTRHLINLSSALMSLWVFRIPLALFNYCNHVCNHVCCFCAEANASLQSKFITFEGWWWSTFVINLFTIISISSVYLKPANDESCYSVACSRLASLSHCFWPFADWGFLVARFLTACR